jgi:hypothetical protein
MGLGNGGGGNWGYFGNTGGFNGGTNQAWMQQQMALQQKMKAQYQANSDQASAAARLRQGAAGGAQQSNQALYENYIDAYKNLYQNQSRHGSSPYSFGNMQSGLSANAGFNLNFGL